MSSWVCAVPNCKNNSSNSHSSFKHDFPRGGQMKQKWLNVCGLKELKSSKTKVCRDHFHESDYSVFSNSPSGGCRLKPNVVPTKNMGRKVTSSSRESTNTPDGAASEDSYMSDLTLEELKKSAKNSSTKVVLDKRDLSNGISTNGKKRPSTDNVDAISDIAEKRRSSSRWGHGFTGKHNSRDLNDVTPCKELKMSEAKPSPKLPTISQAILLLINTDPYKYLGLAPEAIDLVEIIASNLSISEINIVLTFRKLKLDEDFSVLEDYFHLAEGEGKAVFCYTVTTIAKYMRTLVTLPSKYAIFEDIPVASRRTLCQTRFYLSNFSIAIEKTNDFYTNEVTFNGTKHLIHYFYLVTPDGCISYVSPGYGGRLTPDKILPMCRSLRDIIEDGFHIVDLIPDFNENTINPDENLTFEQQVINEVLKKMRLFSLINNKKALDKDFIKCADEIVVIIAALVNLQIVKYDDKEEK